MFSLCESQLAFSLNVGLSQVADYFWNLINTKTVQKGALKRQLNCKLACFVLYDKLCVQYCWVRRACCNLFYAIFFIRNEPMLNMVWC